MARNKIWHPFGLMDLFKVTSSDLCHFTSVKIYIAERLDSKFRNSKGWIVRLVLYILSTNINKKCFLL